MTDRLAVRRDQEVFVAAETEKGVLKVPVSTDYIIALGLAAINQTPTFSNSEEIQNTRDVKDRFIDRMPPGEWSFPIYVRPSGTLGTPPMEDTLLEALFGVKTIVPGTSVIYSQGIEKPSISIWVRNGHTAKFARGATVSSAKISPSTKGGFKIDLSGKFMEMGIVGTQDLAEAIIATATTFKVDDASCYSKGGLVEFYKKSNSSVDDNGGAGYAILDVDTDNDIITTTAITGAFAIDDVCRPFLPAGTEVGAPLANRKTIASIDGVSKNVKKFDISVEDPCVYLEDEITTTEFVEDYVEDTRKIDGSVSINFKQNDAKYYIDNNKGSNAPLQLVCGNTPGSIVTAAMPNCSLEVPKTVDSAPTVSLDMPFTALGNITGEDSLTLAYT